MNLRNGWVEGAVGGWFYRARMIVQAGRVVVAELQLLGGGGKTPRGGVTQAVVRKLPLGSLGPHVLAARSFAAGSGIGGWEASLVRHVPGLGKLTPADTVRPRPRRTTGRDDLFYARLAQKYLAAIKRGSRTPIKDVATATGEKPARVRDMVHEARLRGLLAHGVSGGVGLLPRGQALLEDARKGKR